MKTLNPTDVMPRVMEIVACFNISEAQFCKNIGFDNGSFCRYKNHGKTPSLELILSIVDMYPQVNADWLLTGRGDMFIAGFDKEGLPDTSVIESNDELSGLKAILDAANDAVRKANEAFARYESTKDVK